MNNTPLLKIEHLDKHFGRQHVLNDLTFSIDKGEFVSILGPSGCGKTTLLRVIMGLEPPDSGVIVHNGQDITHLKPNKRGFSIVFQDYALFPHLNLYDNIAYGLKLQKLSHDEIKKRVMPTLELLRLKEAVKKLPSQLSGGMQQRAAIARSLVLGNDLLLLDEPFSALDAVVKVDLGDELKELQRRFGITMIMVTHDQEEAFSLSDRVIVMQKGHIAAFDTPEELYLNRSGDEFIKSFITDQINKRARYVRKLIGGAGHEED